MLWQLDPASSVPLFEQLASSLRRAIAHGELRVGERLPAARDVAASLDINVHTVLRAYQVTRDEGLVELRRGRGAVVIGMPDESRLRLLVRDLAVEASRLGLRRDDLVALVTSEATA